MRSDPISLDRAERQANEYLRDPTKSPSIKHIARLQLQQVADLRKKLTEEKSRNDR